MTVIEKSSFLREDQYSVPVYPSKKLAEFFRSDLVGNESLKSVVEWKSIREGWRLFSQGLSDEAMQTYIEKSEEKTIAGVRTLDIIPKSFNSLTADKN